MYLIQKCSSKLLFIAYIQILFWTIVQGIFKKMFDNETAYYDFDLQIL